MASPHQPGTRSWSYRGCWWSWWSFKFKFNRRLSLNVSPDDRGEWSVVDIPARGDVPTVDSTNHPVENKRPEYHRNQYQHTLISLSHILIMVLTSPVDEQSTPQVRHWPCERAHRLHCTTPEKVGTCGFWFGTKTHLDAIAVRVEEESKLLNKLSRHQFVTKLWHLAEEMVIMVSLTIMTMMMMAMMRQWCSTSATLPSRPIMLRSRSAFSGKRSLHWGKVGATAVLYKCKMYGITSDTFDWWMDWYCWECAV